MIRKHERIKKSQLGQFFTPSEKAEKIISNLELNKDSKVLEPGCGNGSFVIPLIDKFLDLYSGSLQSKLDRILNHNIWAIEFDPEIYSELLLRIKEKYGYLPQKHNLFQDDFLMKVINEKFDIAVGNPPFGATIDYKNQNYLEKEYGFRGGHKIKKESYSFFVVKSIDLLKPNGRLLFICGDSFLTIKTMMGLRKFLIDSGAVDINRLDFFSEETNYPMVEIDCLKGDPADKIYVNGQKILRKHMEMTGNFSWTIDPDAVKYFAGPKISDFMVCSGGITTGNNEYFLKKITDDTLIEEYDYTFYDEPITLEKELEKARLNSLPERTKSRIKEQEQKGETRRNVKIVKRDKPIKIALPHPDYCYYNKASKAIAYEPPQFAIYWKDNGDAVKTFKRNGNWYLHGIGGAPFFFKEGITWSLIGTRIKARFLPKGYVFDSGAPCGFLHNGLNRDELIFILAWLLSDKANYILKKYINHTKNIQGKDVEKLPYPWWIDSYVKSEIIRLMKKVVAGHKPLDTVKEISLLIDTL